MSRGHRPGDRAGDLDEKLVALLDQAEARVRSTLQRMSAPSLLSHAEDIAQEVRLRLWRALDGESNVSFPSSYLHRIVVTACIDAVRAFHSRPDHCASDALDDACADDGVAGWSAHPPNPQELAHDRQLLDLLRTRLAAVSAQTRRFVLLYAQGFTTAEIARVTGSSEPSVRNRLYRTLPALREGFTLQDEDDGR